MDRGLIRYPVLVHGFTGSSASWGERIVDGLAGAGLTPVLVDLPGHGRYAEPRTGAGGVRTRELGPTDTRSGAAPAIALADALAVIAGATRDERADLVGYSMGGRIALHFAAAHPERVQRLVLESASPGLATDAERAVRCALDETLAELLVAEGIGAFVERWEAQPIFDSRATVDARELARHRELRVRNDPAQLVAALRGLGTGALPPLWDRLGDISIPTLLVVGALDRKFVEIAKRMASALPHAEIVVVRGAGHTVHLERPTDWLTAVTSFLGVRP